MVNYLMWNIDKKLMIIQCVFNGNICIFHKTWSSKTAGWNYLSFIWSHANSRTIKNPQRRWDLFLKHNNLKKLCMFVVKLHLLIFMIADHISSIYTHFLSIPIFFEFSSYQNFTLFKLNTLIFPWFSISWASNYHYKKEYKKAFIIHILIKRESILVLLW